MATVPLATFIVDHRGDLLDRCRQKVMNTSDPRVSQARERGIPLFLQELVGELSHGPMTAAEVEASALQHGREAFAEGFSVVQLVHDYGDVCQSVTDLAVETGVTISSEDFRTLNRCLDNAVAAAVDEYANREADSHRREAVRLRNLAYMAVSSFDAVRQGKSGVTGPAGEVLHRSLVDLSYLLNHPPA